MPTAATVEEAAVAALPTRALGAASHIKLAAILAISTSLGACGTWYESPSNAEHDPVFAAQSPAGSVPLNSVSRLDALAAAASTAPSTGVPAVSRTASATPSTAPSTSSSVGKPSKTAEKNPNATPKPTLVVPTVAPKTIATKAPAATPTAAPTVTTPAARAAAEDLRLQPITIELIAQLKAVEPPATQALRALLSAPTVYRIGAGDVLSVAVWGYPELSMSTMTATTTASNDSASAGGVGYLVSAGGYIQFPYIGQVHVVGLTETEAYTKLSAALSRYIRNPQITVRVQNYRSQRVYIDGEVKVPGVYSITDLPMTLPEAINRAGGSLPTSDLSRVQLNRRGKLYTLNMSALVASGINPSSVMLAAGDMLRLPSRDDSKIYVLGEVQKPAAIPMQNGRMSLNQALGEAAGISPVSGNARQVYIVRTRDENQGSPAVYHMDIKAPASLILAEQFALQPGDVVYVDASALASWNRVISLILPSAGLLRTGQQFDNDRR